MASWCVCMPEALKTEQLYTTAVRNMTISVKGYSEPSNVIEMIDNEKKGDSRDV